ncbi:MAG: hypothetical protein ACJ8DC_00040 [Gemmatimonadales bacterium]
MKLRPRIPVPLIVTLGVLLARSPLFGQSSAPKDPAHACELVSNAEVERVTGRHLTEPPGRHPTVQHTESACDFWKAATQIALISIPLSRKTVNRILEGNGFDQTQHALAGVGDSASIYFSRKGQEPEGFLVAYVGPRTLTVRVKMNPGQQPESAQPYAAGLARIAAGRVR